MAKRKKPLHPDAPLYHRSHARPVSRRDFLRQGMVAGTGTLIGGFLLGMFANPRTPMRRFRWILIIQIS